MRIMVTEQLNKDIAAIEKKADNILSGINKLSSIVDSLRSYWGGSDADSFSKKINDDAIPALNKYYDSLMSYLLYLKKVKIVYQKLEEAYDDKIDV
ncbi:MAG: WXG100 family type VII secretion target [Bacilli bacterium]|nr:WXG100 family type VII secretion target [Bacilli bacterium]